MRSSHPGAAGPPPRGAGPAGRAVGADRLHEWVVAGLITPEQAELIRAHEAGRVGTRPGAAPVVVEALGYLGGIIMVIGLGVLVGTFWADVPVPGRLLLTGATVVALLGAGAAVPDRIGPPAGRLRSLLWALAVAATALFMTVLAGDVLDLHDEDALLAIFPPTALVAGLLWWVRRTWLQQLALLVPSVLSAAGIGVRVSDLDTVPGLAVWVVAALWLVLVWLGRLTPRTTGLAFGGVAAVFGAATMPSDAGILLGLATAVGLLVLALVERSLPLLAVAGFALLEAAPRAVVEWFPGRLSASLTLIAVGGVLVAAAVWVARHRRGAVEAVSPADAPTGR